MPRSHLGRRQLHAPVMVREVLSLLVHDPDGVYADCTLGCGGHAAAILGKLSHQGRLIGLDKDGDSLLAANEELKAFGERVFLFRRDFRELPEVLRELSLGAVSGMLFDLGLSSFQLDADRGFSYQKDSPLDMRFDVNEGETAAEILNTRSEEELAELFRQHADLRHARRQARAIVEHRKRGALRTTKDLVVALRRATPSGNPHRALARVFQALRIAVNDELSAIRRALALDTPFLSPGGRVCVISYHSGEDRIVKHFMRENVVFADGLEGRLETLTRRVVRPQPDEVSQNPRSRSARLRAARRS
ncbi:MAG: 16S rRNA (cytosine(1402)-N(4))-methyltransferase RsmH [Candidatus Eisenbacteria bacterium]|nr:16S rRNA (cytosine(1402)-N(4))-methyltransferase RsmH [Candidatus Eisenbacteria bacterium]